MYALKAFIYSKWITYIRNKIDAATAIFESTLRYPGSKTKRKALNAYLLPSYAITSVIK